MKDFPVTRANPRAAAQVNAAHVMSGWTILMNFLGRRAPKTKEHKVVLNINSEVSGVVNAAAYFFESTAAPKLAAVSTLRPLLSSSEKALGGGDALTSASSALVASLEAGLSSCFEGNNFLTPTTVHAVVSRVK